jgi:hypothetical protein
MISRFENKNRSLLSHAENPMQLNNTAKRRGNNRFMFYGLCITGNQNLDSGFRRNDVALSSDCRASMLVTGVNE